MKIVLDSNVLLVALGKKSPYKPIWNAFTNGKFELIVSEDIVYEYHEILQQHSAKGVAEKTIEALVESPDVIFKISTIIGMRLNQTRTITSFQIVSSNGFLNVVLNVV